MFKRILSCIIAMTLLVLSVTGAVFQVSAEENTVYLSDAEGRALEVSMQNGYETVVYDKSIIGGDLRLLDENKNEQIFEKGLGAHAPAEFVYNIEGQGFNYFCSYVGIDRNVGDNGTVIFIVKVDGVEKYNSGLMRGSDSYKSVNVDITGAKTLTLVIDTYEHNANDHSNFAMARFVTLNDAEKAENAVRLIDSIGTVSILSECESKIIAAEKAYESVGNKSLVTNYQALVEARGTYDSLMAEVPDNTVYLSDPEGKALEVSMVNGHDVVRYDKSIIDGDLRLKNANGDEEVFPKGLGAHAVAEFVYNIENSGYQYFMSYVGIDRNVGDVGTVIFSVEVDGVEKYNSGLMRGSDSYKSIEVDIADGKVMTLRVDCYEHNASDHSDFAMARFIRFSDSARIAKTIGLIDAIGTVDVTYISEAKILAAEEAYRNVNDKAAVTNYSVLTAAREAYDRLIASTPAAVVEVINFIEKSYPVTHKSTVPLKAAKAGYEKLSAEEKELVFNYDKMVSALEKVQQMHDSFKVSVTGWPSALQDSCVTGWMATLDTSDQMLTKQAMADEIRRLYVDEGYLAGTTDSVIPVEAWAPTWAPAGIIANVGADGSDSVGKIHDQAWGFAQIGTLISAPFPGMAFSQTRYMSQDFVSNNWAPFISDTFLYNGRYYSMTWEYVKSYDSSIPEVKGNVLSSEQLTYERLYPGIGITNDANNTFRYAYAKYGQDNKAEAKVIGIPTGYAVEQDGVIYQVFEGPDGYAYISGTKENIEAASATPERPEGAYAVTGAIAKAFRGLADTDGERFALTGAPVGEQYEEGNSVCQNFENLTLAVDKITGEVKQTSNDTSFKNFSIPGGAVVEGLGEGINVVVPAGTDVSNLNASFDIHAKSTVTPPAGLQDFTNPVTYTVTSELGAKREYVVTVIVDGPGSEANRLAAKAVIEAIDLLPDEITLADKQQVEEAESAYNALTPAQKYIVTNADKLKSAVEYLNVLSKGKIKVACIGDSVTEGDLGGGRGVNPSTTYPAQLQDMLGEGYEIKNFGKCGAAISRNSYYPYWNVPELAASQEYQPDIVIIMIGTNDAWDGQWNTVKSRFENDYKELVSIYKNLDSKPIIYLTKCSGVNNQHQAMPEMNAIVERISQEMGTQLADMYTWEYNLPDEDKRTLFPDGLHPNEQGYRLMAEEFKKQVFVPLEDSSLKAIYADGAILEDFDPDKTDYTISVSADSCMPVITAETAAGVAKVEITQPNAFDCTAKLKVTAGNPYFMQTYTVTVENSADMEAAKKVIDAIAALGEITADSKAAVASARDAYNSLTDAQKRLVTNADVLKAAIETVKALILDAELNIGITDGVVTGGVSGRANITWNANVTIGADDTLEDINSKLRFTGYGVYYGTSEEAVITLATGGDPAGQAKQMVFGEAAGENDDVDVYTVFGFRLTGIAPERTRAAMFYITFEYEGYNYTVLSDCSTAQAIIE